MEARKVVVGLLVAAVLFLGMGTAIAYDASTPYSNFVDWVISNDTTFTVSVAAGQTKVVFSPASKTETYVNATGQSSGVPIFTVTNAGNCNLDLKCNLTATKPAWAVIMVNDEFVNTGSDEFDTTLVAFNTTVGIGEVSPMYLWTNVTDATPGTQNRTLQIHSAVS